MTSNPPTRSLGCWRSQAWSLVLFLALLRGLVPHAVLAAALDDGDPRLRWCAPGVAAPVEGFDPAAALAAHAQCACAPAADALAVPAPFVPGLPAASTAPIPLTVGASAPIYPRTARSRGPPSQLG
jgi:hypothetical protein